MLRYLTGILTLISINVTAVCGVTILTGFTGLFSLGHAAFVSIGAYTAAILLKTFHFPFFIALILAGLVASVFSLIIGYPTMRGKMQGDYFAIAMLGFAETVRLALSNIYPYVNGALGISGIPKHSTLETAVMVAAVSVFLTWNYTRSQHGQIALSIRDEETAAELIGVNVMWEKIKSLMVSAFFCGIAGCLFACYYTYISPNTFSATMSNDFLAAVVFGGMGSLTGPIIASAFLTTLPELLRFVDRWRLVLYGFVMVIVMLFRPEGLMGGKEFSITKLFRAVRRLVFRKADQKREDSEVFK